MVAYQFDSDRSSSSKPKPMNPNALKNKSNFKIEKTYTGAMAKNVGFRKTDGVIKPKEEYYNELRKNGYTIEFTPNGVLVTPPNK